MRVTNRVGVNAEVTLEEREVEREGDPVTLPLLLVDTGPLNVGLTLGVEESDKNAVEDKNAEELPQRVGDVLGHWDEKELGLGDPVVLGIGEGEIEGKGEELMQVVVDIVGENDTPPLLENKGDNVLEEEGLPNLDTVTLVVMDGEVVEEKDSVLHAEGKIVDEAQGEELTVAPIEALTVPLMLPLAMPESVRNPEEVPQVERDGV